MIHAKENKTCCCSVRADVEEIDCIESKRSKFAPSSSLWLSLSDVEDDDLIDSNRFRKILGHEMILFFFNPTETALATRVAVDV